MVTYNSKRIKLSSLIYNYINQPTLITHTYQCRAQLFSIVGSYLAIQCTNIFIKFSFGNLNTCFAFIRLLK